MRVVRTSIKLISTDFRNIIFTLSVLTFIIRKQWQSTMFCVYRYSEELKNKFTSTNCTKCENEQDGTNDVGNLLLLIRSKKHNRNSKSDQQELANNKYSLCFFFLPETFYCEITKVVYCI